MRRILVATDFSPRSERALLRASLLAREASAALVIVHAIDDDQPPPLLAAAQREAGAQLDAVARGMGDADGPSCETHVALGFPFQAIADASARFAADLVVMGPHRRQALQYMFVGTTVERTIRLSRKPVVMTNAVPAGPYQRVLVATDFSDCSVGAALAARQWGLVGRTGTAFVHAFDAPAQDMMLRSWTTMRQMKDYLAEEKTRASARLDALLDSIGARPARRFLLLNEISAGQTILACARDYRADLIVVGTHGRAGLGRILLGSVAEEVLSASEADVLVVPHSEAAEEA
ncbi:MAG: universal stress protein [Alphaproteobacteria bacterium]